MFLLTMMSQFSDYHLSFQSPNPRNKEQKNKFQETFSSDKLSRQLQGKNVP